MVGKNGAGKTNVLDAVHYLSMCKSFLNPIDSQNIKNDEGFFVLNGHFEKEGKLDQIHCGVKRGQKKTVKRNKKEYEKLSEHIGAYPVVMISPYDTNLILDGSEIRRKFIDSIISQYDKQYLKDLIQYKKLVQHRNVLLKSFSKSGFFDQEQLWLWTEGLIELSESIYSKRKKFIEEFKDYFQLNYDLISGKEELVELKLQTQLEGQDSKSLFESAIQKDRVLSYTSVGTHKDDLLFFIHEKPVKKFASQGQQKSYLIALKLAKYQFLKEKIKDLPILLLDDIFDKLDHSRVKNLLHIVSNEKFGQVLLTDTDINRLESVLNECDVDFDIFKIEKGEVVYE